MDTKLTLALDQDIIDRAKQYASQRNTSISKLVENFLARITVLNPQDEPAEDISPLVKRLSGVLTLPSDLDTKQAYRDHLSDKYGK